MPRFAARILELRQDGYRITSVSEGNGARYTLTGLGSVEGAQSSGDAVEPGESRVGGRAEPSISSAGAGNATPGAAAGVGRPMRPSREARDVGENPLADAGSPDLQLFGESPYERLSDAA